MKEEIEIPDGYTLTVEGPGEVELIEGELEVFGAKLIGRHELAIPEGRKVPLESITNSFVRVDGGWKLEEGSSIPTSWRELVDEVCGKRTIMIIGENDTGKSSLTLYLANKAIEKGCKPAIVDSDIGQTDLGPPGTIGLALPSSPVPSYSDMGLVDAYFVGDKTPSGHLLPMIVGTKRMIDRALELGASNVMINTTGLIRGGVGWALKYHKIEIVRPELLIGVQKRRELSQILMSIMSGEVIIMKPPKAVGKGRSSRAAYRSLTLARYFEGAVEISVNLNDVKVVNARTLTFTEDGTLEDVVERGIGERPLFAARDDEEVVVVFGEKLDPHAFYTIRRLLVDTTREFRLIDAEKLRGIYLGLYDGKGVFAGVGRLLKIDFRRREIRAYAKAAVKPSDLGYIVFGNLVLDDSSNEIGSLRPGYL